MAIEKKVVITADTSDAVKEVNKFNSEITNTKQKTKELSGTMDSFSGGAITKVKGLIAGVKGLALGFKSVGVAIAASGLGLLLITISAIKSAFTSSEEGQNKFAKIMGVIGSVVGNLNDVLSDFGELVIGLFSGDGEAIKSAKSFGKKLFDVVGLPIKNIIDVVKTAGNVLKGLWDNGVQGGLDALSDGVDSIKENFKEAGEAINSAKNSLSEFTQQAIKDAEIAEKIANKRSSADKISRQLITERAESERKIAELRDKASRKDLFNAQQRKAFLIEASNINEEITDKELFAARLRANAIVEENKLSKSTKEDKDKEAEALAKVIQLETKRLNLKKRLGTEISAINQQEKSEAEALAKAKELQNKKDADAEFKRLELIENIKKKFRDADLENDAKTRQEKLDLDKARAQEDLDLLIGTETEKKEAQLALDSLYNQKQKELNTVLNEEKIQSEKETAEKLKEEIQSLQNKRNEIAENEELNGLQKASMLFENLFTELKINDLSKASMQEKADFAANLLKASSAALGKETAAGKAAAIAATTIDTIQSGVSAYKGMVAAIPGPVGIAAGAVAAAGSLASGYASVKKILSVKTPNGGGGGSAPGGGASAPQAPAFNLVGQSGVNQVQESLQEEQTPIQAFVVGAEVTSQQELDRNQQNSASI